MNKVTLLLASLLLICSCSDDKDIIDPEVDDSFEFVGKWLGQWSDSLFPVIQVSTEVREVSPNKYSGAFYFSSGGNVSYTPCCGGVNDGTMSFETKGDSVINFLLLQNAPEYRGGCPGTYRGAGIVDNKLNRLTINFSGEDCDGLHENGKIV